MVAAVVVVCCWRLRGTIIWGVIFTETTPGGMLASETKIARLISRDSTQEIALQNSETWVFESTSKLALS
jgi:hypothetical protein